MWGFLCCNMLLTVSSLHCQRVSTVGQSLSEHVCFGDLLTGACMCCRTAMTRQRLVPSTTLPARLSPPSIFPPMPSVLATLLPKTAQSSLLVSSPLCVLLSNSLDEYMSQQVLYVCASVCLHLVLTHVSWGAFVHMSVCVNVCTIS